MNLIFFRLEDTSCQSLLQAANMLPVHIQGYYRQRSDIRDMVSYVKYQIIYFQVFMKASVLFILSTKLLFILDVNFQNKSSNIVVIYISDIFRPAEETIILCNIEVFVMLSYIVLFVLFITQIEEKASTFTWCM